MNVLQVGRMGSWTASRSASRRAFGAWLFVAGLLACLLILSGDTRAQDEPVADGAAAAAPADPAAAPATSATPSVKDMSYLEWTFQSLGWRYTIVFLFLSFTLVAYVVMILLMARRENICPLPLVESFESSLDEEKYQDAYEIARGDESFLGQVLAAGLAKLSTSGYPQAIESMQEVAEEENMKFDHRLSYIALIGTVAPMVGLLGTVEGMISSFQVIASSNTQPKPSELAAGIATALFTTLVGLVIAIPAIAAHNLIRNRISRLVLEAGILSGNLMSRFEVKK
jgi:biopolymer transport protein ExbB